MTSDQDLIDFLKLPDASASEKALADLADLRLHARHPEGLGGGSCLSHASRNRLIAHAMLEYRGSRAYATAYGIQVVRANASCVDGSEGLRTQPGRGRDIADELEANIERITAGDHSVTGGVFMPMPISRAAYDATLLAALAEVLSPPAPDLHPLAVVRAQHAARMGVGAAVVRWIGRRWCYAKLVLMIHVGGKDSRGRVQ